MPDDVLNAPEKENLFEAYESRPPYQQNDYVGWISSAKRPETQAAYEGALQTCRPNDE